MLATVHTAALQGVDAYPVRVEVHLASGLPCFTVVGLAQSAVREGRERVASALANVGRPVPPRRITVNLAPADVRKEGSAFDLPVAVGVLAVAGVVPPDVLQRVGFLGELGLDGRLRPVRGALASVAALEATGVGSVVVPVDNAGEAAAVGALQVLPARTLEGVIRHLRGEELLPPWRPGAGASRPGGATAEPADLRDVKGQEAAKRALEVCAAGGHNLLLVGPPGSGKTMLARRLPGILPALTPREALEATRVHSVAGTLEHGMGLLRRRPFRAPHHTVSDAGLVGGGTPPRPGEVSLAHHGVLFLDELPEFRRPSLEALRQPMEDGVVRVARAAGTVSFPARFLFVGAMNPCPCGFRGDGTDRCLCDDALVARYRGRVSGPLLDRIDVQVEVGPVSFSDLAEERRGKSSVEIAARVVAARNRQTHRYRDVPGVHANAQLGPRLVGRFCRHGPRVAAFLREAAGRLGLSARAYHRVLKVARTVADLHGAADVEEVHVAEALVYRGMDRDPQRAGLRVG